MHTLLARVLLCLHGQYNLWERADSDKNAIKRKQQPRHH